MALFIVCDQGTNSLWEISPSSPEFVSVLFNRLRDAKKDVKMACDSKCAANSIITITGERTVLGDNEARLGYASEKRMKSEVFLRAKNAIELIEV